MSTRDGELIDPDDDFKGMGSNYFASVARFMMNCVGGPIGASAGAWSEAEQARINERIAALLAMDRERIKEMVLTLLEVEARLDTNDERIKQRIESPEYLSLVRKCFREWSGAESKEKRAYIRNLLVNAAQTKITDDDTLRLFIKWIDEYSEMHFAVIKVVHKSPGVTRAAIWEDIKGAFARDDSPEADLFKLLVHDLSMGHIMRQSREVNDYGQFVRKARSRPVKSNVLQTAFEDTKPYELTALGTHFVHYVMTEQVGKIGERATA